MLYPLSYGGGVVILPALGAESALAVVIDAWASRQCGLELGQSRANIRNGETRNHMTKGRP